MDLREALKTVVEESSYESTVEFILCATESKIRQECERILSEAAVGGSGSPKGQIEAAKLIYATELKAFTSEGAQAVREWDTAMMHVIMEALQRAREREAAKVPEIVGGVA
jgi:hypothetical protein